MNDPISDNFTEDYNLEIPGHEGKWNETGVDDSSFVPPTLPSVPDYFGLNGWVFLNSLSFLYTYNVILYLFDICNLFLFISSVNKTLEPNSRTFANLTLKS